MIGSGLIGLLVTLVILGLIFYLVWWFLGQIGLPEPFNKIALAIVALVVLVVLINLLLGLGHVQSGPLFSWHS